MIYHPNLEQVIGEGTCGRIYRSQEKPDEIAMKEINSKYLYIYTDYFITLTQRSKYLLSLFQVYPINDIYYITMEYLGGEDLLDYIVRKNGLAEPIYKKNKISKRSNLFVKKIIKKILYAIEYLHQNNVIHCDIKLENIRLLENSKIKLFDYHLTTYIDTPNKRLCGSSGYMAPEMLFNGYDGYSYYNEKIDIWSLGICLSVMMECQMVLTTNYFKYLRYLRKHERLNDLTYLLNEKLWDKPLLKIFKSMTDSNPRNRKSAFELIQILEEHIKIIK